MCSEQPRRRGERKKGLGLASTPQRWRDAGTCPLLLFSLLTARLFVAQENCREGERCTCLSCRNKQDWKAVVNGAELYPSSSVPSFFLSVLWTSPGQIWGQHGLYNVWSHPFFCIWSSYSFGYRKWRVYSRIPGLFCNPREQTSCWWPRIARMPVASRGEEQAFALAPHNSHPGHSQQDVRDRRDAASQCRQSVVWDRVACKGQADQSNCPLWVQGPLASLHGANRSNALSQLLCLTGSRSVFPPLPFRKDVRIINAFPGVK